MATITPLGSQATIETKGMASCTEVTKSDGAPISYPVWQVKFLQGKGAVKAEILDKNGAVVDSAFGNYSNGLAAAILLHADTDLNEGAYVDLTSLIAWNVGPTNFSTGSIRLTAYGKMDNVRIIHANGIPFPYEALCVGNGVVEIIIPFTHQV
jgi:hypothetical protein